MRALGARDCIHWVHALACIPPPSSARPSCLSCSLWLKTSRRRVRLKVNPLGSVPKFPPRYLAKNHNARPFSVLPSWSVPKFYVPARRVAAPRTEVSTSPNGGFHFPQRGFSLPPMGVFTSPHEGFLFPMRYLTRSGGFSSLGARQFLGRPLIIPSGRSQLPRPPMGVAHF